jgi:hypothetical protein
VEDGKMTISFSESGRERTWQHYWVVLLSFGSEIRQSEKQLTSVLLCHAVLPISVIQGCHMARMAFLSQFSNIRHIQGCNSNFSSNVLSSTELDYQHIGKEENP